MDRTVLVERIFDMQPDALAFPQPDERAWHSAVDADGMAGAAVDRDRLVRDAKVNILARHHRQITQDPR